MSRVDVGAMFEQVSGDLDRAGEVQWSLAVTTPRVHTLWVRRNDLAQAVHPPKPRRGVNVHDGPAVDGILGKLEIGNVQKAESACPPPTLGIDIGPRGKQQIDHFAAPRWSGRANRTARSGH